MTVDADTHKRNLRLYADTGTNSDLIPEETPDDSDILGLDDVWTQTTDKYPSDTSKQDAFARAIIYNRLLAPSALQGKYVQNQSEEDLTKVFDNLEKQRDYWTKQIGLVSDPVEDTFIGGNIFARARGRRGR